MEVSLNYCSQNGGKLYRAPYYNGNPNIGPRIIGNLDQSPNDSVGKVAAAVALEGLQQCLPVFGVSLHQHAPYGFMLPRAPDHIGSLQV